MIITFLKLLLCQFGVMALGFLVLCSLKKKIYLIESIGLSYLIGIGLFTNILFVLNYYMKIAYNGFNSIIILFVLLIIFAVFAVRRFKENKVVFIKVKLSKFTFLEKSIVIMIFIFLISSLINSLYWPITDWDALTLYDFRAKIILQNQYLNNILKGTYYTGYPMLTSIAHYWVYLSGFKTPMIVYFLFYLSLISVCYHQFSQYLSQKNTIIFTLLVALSPPLYEHSTTAYTNLPYSIYLVLGSIYLINGIVDRQRDSILISALLLGISTWTRSVEPFWILPVPLLLIDFVKYRNAKTFILWILIFSSFLLPWKYFQTHFTNADPSSKLISESSLFVNIINNLNIKQTLTVVNYLWQYIVMYYPHFFVIFVLILINSFTIKNKKLNYILIIIIGALLFLFGGTFIFSITQTYWQSIPGSVQRMMMFWPVLIIFTASYLFNKRK